MKFRSELFQAYFFRKISDFDFRRPVRLHGDGPERRRRNHGGDHPCETPRNRHHIHGGGVREHRPRRLLRGTRRPLLRENHGLLGGGALPHGRRQLPPGEGRARKLRSQEERAVGVPDAPGRQRGVQAVRGGVGQQDSLVPPQVQAAREQPGEPRAPVQVHPLQRVLQEQEGVHRPRERQALGRRGRAAAAAATARGGDEHQH